MILNRQRTVRVARPPLELFLRRVREQLGLGSADVAICLVSDAEIAHMNETFRKKSGPTDVLSFPVDGAEASAPGGGVPRELGDIVICPAHTLDVSEAIVHGALHLLGMDHETDDGEMLALQAEIVRWGNT